MKRLDRSFYVRRIPTLTHIYDDGTRLIVDPKTASWAVVDNMAYNFFQDISIHRYKVIENPSDKIKSCLISLYRAGLVEFENKPRKFSSNLYENVEYPFVFMLLRITNYCNLDCRYCYAKNIPGKTSHQEMDELTAYKAIDLLLQSEINSVGIVFSGGEPLLGGINKIIKIQKYVLKQAKEKRKEIDTAIQTNGTLLSEDTIRILEAHNIQMSISFDILASIHDANRKKANGYDSYEVVHKAMCKVDRLMRTKRDEMRPGFIAVITKEFISNVGDISNMLVNRLWNYGWQFNIIDQIGRGRKNIKNPSAESIFSALRILLEKSLENGRLFNPIRYMLFNILMRERGYMCFRSPCGAGNAMLSIDPDGTIFPCDSFLGRKDFEIGNIHDYNKLSDILNSPVVKLLRQRQVQNIPECSKCIWQHFCCGGCPGDAYAVNGKLLSPSSICRLSQMLFPYLIRKVVEDKRILHLLRVRSERNRYSTA